SSDSAPPTTVQPPPATETPLGPQQRRTTDILRVRVGPGIIYPVLGRLRADRIIDIVARTLDSQWLEIAYPDAKRRGWVKAVFVAPESGFYSFPVSSAPPLPRPSSVSSA